MTLMRANFKKGLEMKLAGNKFENGKVFFSIDKEGGFVFDFS